MEITRAERIRLGVFLLSGMALIAGFALFYVGQRVLERRTPYYTRFAESVDGLYPGAKVKWNGVTVGQVTRIRIDERNLQDVIVEYEVQEGTPVKASVRANLVGGLSVTGLKNIELTGGQSQEVTLPAGSEILAGTSQLKQITGQAEAIVFKTETLINNMLAITGDENQANLSASLRNLANLAARLDTLLERNSRHVDSISGHLHETLRHAAAAAFSARQSMELLQRDMQGARLGNKVEMLAEEMQKAVRGFERSALSLEQKIQALDVETAVKGVNNATKGVETAAKRADITLYRIQEDLAVSVRRLKETAENMADFSRQIKENPSLLLRGEEKQGRQR